jgi:probable rRNA maturation factor
MTEPPSPTVGSDTTVLVGGADEHVATVIASDTQDELPVDVDRWGRLALAVLRDVPRGGELTLTFVGRDEIADLNVEHLGQSGPTDVLSFPLDDQPSAAPTGVPVLLGDVVVCPAVAADQASGHAGSLDDELALLVVHGVLHVLGHDHAEAEETATMRAAELRLLEAHHWGGPAPAAFRQEQP